MYLNARALFKAAIVSITWGAVATFGMLLITSTYLAASIDGQMHVVTGLDAIRSQIAAFGYSGYFKTFFGIYALIVAIVFVGCLLFGQWTARSEQNDA